MNGSDEQGQDATGTPRRAHPAAFREGDVVGRYAIRRQVGAGGMGVVYEAEDRELGRPVALKFLLGVDERALKRFLAEARGQARLDHPAICRVYEAGDIEGLRYIAMEFVEGQTIDAARSEMTLRDKVAVLRQVCEGIHAAHRLGLVHRDLKPSNILVTHGEDGAWTPFVTDFGLIKDLGADQGGLTEDGVPVGSPAFMPPEQARGDVGALDQRCDVYSLGATLYDALCGSPPFVGRSPMELILQVIQDDVDPLHRRQADIPADLEAIVMKCLEKEPGDRYPSAQALADDLGRFLAGDVVTARPVGTATRLWRKARQHRILVAAAMVALLAFGTLLGISLRTRWQAQRRAELAQQLGQEVSDLEWELRTAYLRPPHDVTEERREVDRRVEALATRVAQAGRAAEGPGAVAMGRAELARGNPDRAVEHLEQAWARGHQGPDVAMGLGLALGEIYQRELAALAAIEEPDLRRERRDAIQIDYRDPALHYLALGGDPRDARTRTARAQVAFYEGRIDEAVALCREEHGASADYELDLLLGQIQADQGTRAREKGALDEAEAAFVEARSALDRAAEVGRSDPAVHLARVDLDCRVMALREVQGAPFEAELASALQACEIARTIDPGSPEPLLALARVRGVSGTVRGGRGFDPMPDYEAALEAVEAAIELAPEEPDLLARRGELLYSIAVSQRQGGDAPTQKYRQSIESLEAALALQPNHDVALLTLSRAFAAVADRERRAGTPPSDAIGAAIEAAERGIALYPEQAAFHAELGSALMQRIALVSPRSEESQELLPVATTAFDRAVELDPVSAPIVIRIGRAYIDLAYVELATGLDPVPKLDSAIIAYERAIELRPDLVFGHRGLALALFIKADHLSNRGLDPSTEVQRTLAVCDLLEAIDPDYRWVDLYRGNALMSRALYELVTGEDPRPSLEAAEAAMQDSLARIPGDPSSHLNLGLIHTYEARYLIHGGRSGVEATRRSRQQFRLSGIDDGGQIAALIGAAMNELVAARATPNGPVDTEALLRAEGWCVRVAELDTQSSYVPLIRAEARYRHAESLSPGSEDRGARIEEGLVQAQRARELSPDDPMALILHGALLLLDGRGEPGDAEAGRALVEQGFAANPTLRWEWGHLLEDAP